MYNLHKEAYMKKGYLLLAVIGTILPDYVYINFLLENGIDIKSIREYLYTNTISPFLLLISF